MQGMIPMTSIRSFSTEEDWSTTSFVMRIHERHPKGWPNLNFYMTNYFKETKDFASFVYGSMVMQAYAIETAIQALRRSRPYNMGSLYWQINDVWPVFSWASVDFYGQWKALHYRSRASYEDLVVFSVPLGAPADGQFEIHAINERLTPALTSLVLEIMSFNGTQLATFRFDQLLVPANNRRRELI
jgi:beta-mannosidase